MILKNDYVIQSEGAFDETTKRIGMINIHKETINSLERVHLQKIGPCCLEIAVVAWNLRSRKN